MRITGILRWLTVLAIFVALALAMLGGSSTYREAGWTWDGVTTVDGTFDPTAADPIVPAPDGWTWDSSGG